MAQPIRELLRQGLTVEGVAFSLGVGVAVGLFPVLGATTVLGFAIGGLLRLNMPAVQIANWLAYPLQLAAIVPFVRLGESLTGAPAVSFSVAEVATSASVDPLGAVGRFGLTGLHAILGWMAIAPTVLFVVYHALLPVLRLADMRVPTKGIPAEQESR